MLEVDRHIKNILKTCLQRIEAHFSADALFFYGEIAPGLDKLFRDLLEDLQTDTPPNKKLVIIINTPGGSAETTEKLVDIIRYHYDEVIFIVPDYAMSAGTILCMSGNQIYMDYASTLGPIDPQVLVGQDYVPALGYLDKVDEMLAKSAAGTLTPAEFVMLQSLDLGLLRRHEQAKDLTINLLKEWLVKYKFSNWTNHRTDATKLGQTVTTAEKAQRAEEIARDLGSNTKWHSHGRHIGVEKLKSLRLEIDDYSADLTLRSIIRDYNDVIVDYIGRGEYSFFWHTRKS